MKPLEKQVQPKQRRRRLFLELNPDVTYRLRNHALGRKDVGSFRLNGIRYESGVMTFDLTVAGQDTAYVVGGTPVQLGHGATMFVAMPFRFVPSSLLEAVVYPQVVIETPHHIEVAT